MVVADFLGLGFINLNSDISRLLIARVKHFCLRGPA